MGLKQILGGLIARDLIITPRLTAWLLDGGTNRPVPARVARLIASLLTEPRRDRSGAFHASDAGTCSRRQVLSYLGMHAAPVADPRTVQILADGTWRHLRWQTNLLAAGVLDDVEIPVAANAYRLSGTIDGEGHDRDGAFGFELKGANDFAFRQVVGGTTPDTYLGQVARYFLARPDLDRFSLVIENKNDQRWKEFVVDRDEAPIDTERRALAKLNSSIDSRRLPKALPECQQGQGAYRSCPYAPRCLELRSFDDLPVSRAALVRAVRRRQ